MDPNLDYPKPLRRTVPDGFWRDPQMSHEGRYIAAAWAASHDTMSSGQRLLGILDTQEPDDVNAHIKNPPGGEAEKVDKIQWVSDTDMIVRNQSGRKFLWHVLSNTYDELPRGPASFNGYAILSEFYAPDGLRYGGLMSKDGGATTEVWTSKPDYSDMQQVTQAGLKLEQFDWLGSSNYLMVFSEGLGNWVEGKCSTAIIDTGTARSLSARQIEASRTPSYLPCSFKATR